MPNSPAYRRRRNLIINYETEHLAGDQRQHREHRLHQHPVLPCTTLTQFEVGGIALRGMEASVTQDNHPSVNVSDEPLKGVIGDIGRRTVPSYHQAILV